MENLLTSLFDVSEFKREEWETQFSNVPIKYVIGTFKHNDDFPTLQDIIWLLTINCLGFDNKSDITFSEEDLNDILNQLDTEYKSKSLIKELIEDGIIETNTENQYTIIKNVALNG